MRTLSAVFFGLMLSLMTMLAAPQNASAASLSIGSTNTIQKDQPLIAEQVRYRGGRSYGNRGYGGRMYGGRGYGRSYGHRGYGHRGYGYRGYRSYGYGYAPVYSGGYRRCVVRYRTYFNGYRYVRRPVRVCRRFY